MFSFTERIDWYFELAHTIAKASKDRSTKVGCIIVGPDKEIRAQGYNGFPRGCNDNNEEWKIRPTKYLVTVHAEANAVANAALTGTKIKGCSAFITSPPCANCAALLINSGIKRVYFDSIEPKGEHFIESHKIALKLFRECNIAYFINRKELIHN